MRGLALSAARYSLLRLEDAPPHTKNWRPQILMLVNFNADLPKYRKIFSLVSQLKAGKGLTVSATVIEGDFVKKTGHDVQSTKKELVRLMDEEKVKGFADVLVSKNTSEGLSHLWVSFNFGLTLQWRHWLYVSYSHTYIGYKSLDLED